ncbi:MAG: hypothetical protein II879_12490 [Clostridia bacterium]|nr:hypothetical protein [Clostridia bacterium]
MISTEDYKRIVSELLDELPEAFFRDLTGGVIVSEAHPVPDYAHGNDLYTMGLYKVFSGVRQIVMYKGSFDRAYPLADEAEARRILRGVLRHEFRHHLEFLGGIHDSTSLEAEDERKKRAYLARHAESARTALHEGIPEKDENSGRRSDSCEESE